MDMLYSRLVARLNLARRCTSPVMDGFPKKDKHVFFFLIFGWFWCWWFLNDSSWYSIVLEDVWWFLMMSDDFWWFCMISSSVGYRFWRGSMGIHLGTCMYYAIHYCTILYMNYMMNGKYYALGWHLTQVPPIVIYPWGAPAHKWLGHSSNWL